MSASGKAVDLTRDALEATLELNRLAWRGVVAEALAADMAVGILHTVPPWGGRRGRQWACMIVRLLEIAYLYAQASLRARPREGTGLCGGMVARWPVAASGDSKFSSDLFFFIKSFLDS